MYSATLVDGCALLFVCAALRAWILRKQSKRSSLRMTVHTLIGSRNIRVLAPHKDKVARVKWLFCPLSSFTRRLIKSTSPTRRTRPFCRFSDKRGKRNLICVTSEIITERK